MKGPSPRVVRRYGMAGKGARHEVTMVGLPSRPLGDVYHALMTASWPRIFGIILALYLGVNATFAVAYLASGGIENAAPGSIEDAFFFSVQTMATIGYGKMAPVTPAAHAIVTVEALTGLIGFAFATGLIFAKFARPSARVMWSRPAIVAPRDGVRSLMFRMANERANQIAEAHLRVVLSRIEKTAEGETVRRFYDLALSRSSTTVFALSWTAIHPITQTSPLFGETAESLAASESEIIASLQGTDEGFSQTIHARHVYFPEAIHFGARFADIMLQREDGSRCVDYTRFHEVIEALPATAGAEAPTRTAP